MPRVSPVLAPLLGLPEVSVGVSFSGVEAVGYDGLRTTSSWQPVWAVGLTCAWRRPTMDERDDAGLEEGRRRIEVAAVVARLWAERARPVEARTLREQVHAALRLAEIDARLAALEPGPEEP